MQISDLISLSSASTLNTLTGGALSAGNSTALATPTPQISPSGQQSFFTPIPTPARDQFQSKQGIGLGESLLPATAQSVQPSPDAQMAIILQLLQMLVSKIQAPASNENGKGVPSVQNPSQSAGNVANNSRPGVESPANGKQTPVSGTKSTADIGIGTVNGVEFGVNARPTWGNSSYQKLSLDDQMQKVKSMGLGTYAFDLKSGNAKQDLEILNAADRNGVKVQANLGMDRNSFKNFDDAYAAAKAEGQKSGKLYGDRVSSFQLDNELDAWVYPNGSTTPDPQRLKVAEGIIKGLHDGLKETAPDIKTIVNTTQAPSGISLLKQFQKDGLDWDVTGFHWYSGNGTDITTSGGTGNGGGTTLGNVSALGKPIAITEFNGTPQNGQGPTANRSANANIVSNQMKDIIANAKKYNIISANVHELMDEPELDAVEGNFGMLDPNGNPTVSSNSVAAVMKQFDKS
jgi:hypothetical protein